MASSDERCSCSPFLTLISSLLSPLVAPGSGAAMSCASSWGCNPEQGSETHLQALLPEHAAQGKAAPGHLSL